MPNTHTATAAAKIQVGDVIRMSGRDCGVFRADRYDDGTVSLGYYRDAATRSTLSMCVNPDVMLRRVAR